MIHILKLTFLIGFFINGITLFSQDNSRSITLVDDISDYVKKNGKTFKDYQIFFIHKENNTFKIANGAAVGVPQTSSSEIIILKNPEFTGTIKIVNQIDKKLHSIDEKNLSINIGDFLTLATKENQQTNTITIK